MTRLALFVLTGKRKQQARLGRSRKHGEEWREASRNKPEQAVKSQPAGGGRGGGGGGQVCQISKGARKKTQSGFRVWRTEADAKPFHRRSLPLGPLVACPGFVADWLRRRRRVLANSAHSVTLRSTGASSHRSPSVFPPVCEASAAEATHQTG